LAHNGSIRGEKEMFFDKEVDIPKANKYLSEEEVYRMARKRVKVKKGFAIHAGVYFMVNMGIFGIDMLTTQFNPPWFLFPLFGWGIGLGCHYIDTVAKLKFDLKDSAIQREMDHLYKNFDRDK
jgi:hypothetical protein